MTAPQCPFCTPDASRIIGVTPLTLSIWDGFPVSRGHALIIPKRHVASWFEATAEEQAEILAAIDTTKQEIQSRHSPDGFNIGINIGEAAGQTVPHLHVHLIPRFSGDTADPRGGVRHVIPSKANYLAIEEEGAGHVADRPESADAYRATALGLPHSSPLISGGSDPFLPHIRAHLDSAEAADIAVAFVTQSGLGLLEDHLEDMLRRGGRLRFLTGDYLHATEAEALLRLLDIQERWPDLATVRVFTTPNGGSFHPKAYIFRETEANGIAFVGSSNLTRIALSAGIEWNLRMIGSNDRAGFSSVLRSFEDLFFSDATDPLDSAWIDEYAGRKKDPEKSSPQSIFAPPEEEREKPPEPHSIQKRALAALEKTRGNGHTAGLVVLATGLGKTWLAAFDSYRDQFKRILFVAHREEILRQSMKTFRKIRPGAAFGLYTGKEKTPDADVVFASIQTLGRAQHLERFRPDEFDYLVVDEFHHAAAKSYRKLIDYFEPKFFLGLTATPERTDGGDLLGLAGDNLVFRCDLAEGIAEGLLSPFHYFGVPDDVNYENIPWRSNRFDPEALTNALATQARAENALDQFRTRGGERALGFCSSTSHADFMRDFFRNAGLRAAAVHSDTSSDPRAASLEELSAGDLDIVFAVDIFNEGVDVPSIDTILMLRPTESKILWLQQFGRGLRKLDTKPHLNVIDYIGNHRTFLSRPQMLFNLPPGDVHIDRLLSEIQSGEEDLPEGCEVTYDLEAINLLRGLTNASPPDVLKFAYEDFKQRHGIRPTASELCREGYRPRHFRKTHGSWLGFVDDSGDLSAQQRSLIRDGRTAKFLDELEETRMTKSYKMVVLDAMLNAGQLPGEMTVAELARAVVRSTRYSPDLRSDLGEALDNPRKLEKLLRDNPINAWVGGGTPNKDPFFELEGDRFRTLFNVKEGDREDFQALTSELVEWRLAEYSNRASALKAQGEAIYSCKVSHSQEGRPLLFLPARPANPDLPEGWTEILADGETYEGNFVKIALNVIRRPGTTDNVLPQKLIEWFGPNAGASGTNQTVTLTQEESGWVLSPKIGTESARV